MIKKEKNIWGNKRAMELALNTMILLALGLIVLIGLVVFFNGGMAAFGDKMSLIFGSNNVDSFVERCNMLASNNQQYEYCCINKTAKISSDKKIQVSCLSAENMSWANDMEKINCDDIC